MAGYDLIQLFNLPVAYFLATLYTYKLLLHTIMICMLVAASNSADRTRETCPRQYALLSTKLVHRLQRIFVPCVKHVVNASEIVSYK